MEPVYLATERRGSEERRALSWRTMAYGFLLSRRQGLRRDGEEPHLFSDWHHPWLFFLSLGIMLLGCIDAFLTLHLLEQGMSEVNPVMAALMKSSTRTFVAGKVALTGIGILTLVFLARVYFMNRFRTGLLLTFFFCGYCCLVCYEAVHLLRIL